MDGRRWSMMDGSEPLNMHEPQLRAARGPVLQPLKRQSLQPLRQRLNSGGDTTNGTEKKPLQLWQILQEERESHQQTLEREKQLKAEVNRLRENLEELKQNVSAYPLENKATLSDKSERLQLANDSLRSKLTEEQGLIQAKDEQLLTQDFELKKLKEQLHFQELQQNSIEQTYNIGLQQAKNELESKVEKIEKRSRELQNELDIKESEAKERKQEFELNLEKMDVLGKKTKVELEVERKNLKEAFDTLRTEIEAKADLKSQYEKILSAKDTLIKQKDTELLLQENKLLEQCDKLQFQDELQEKFKCEKEQLSRQLEEQVEAMNKRTREEEDTLKEMQHEKLQTNLEEQVQHHLVKISEMEERYQQQQATIAEQAEKLNQKDAELRKENTKLQFIEEKVNQFDVKLTDQIQELHDQISLNEQLQTAIAEREEEIIVTTEKMREQSTEIEEMNQKLIVLDMLEEELRQKNASIMEKDRILNGVESIKEDCLQLQGVIERLKKDVVKTTQSLEEKETQSETLRTFCRHQLQQQEEQLLLQYKLESRLQEQIFHLERNQIEIDEKNKQLEMLETIQEELKQKDLQVLNKEYKLQSLPSLQEKLRLQDLQLQENIQEKMKQDERIYELESELHIADELKNACALRVEELDEDIVVLRQKVEQLELQVSQRDTQIQNHEEELERSNLYSLELMRKQQVVEDWLEKAQEEILDQKNQISENLVQLEEKNQLFKTLTLQINEKDTEIENVRLSLVCLTQEKQELNETIEQLKKFIEEQGRDIDLQDQSLQKQDRYIQRLHQSNLQLEQDLQIHQQDSLRQHQDLIEDYIQAKEILEQQLLKQNLLLQQQDLKLHQQDEKIQEINQKSKFYSWGGKKK